VTLGRAGRQARLTIADDGAGFDVRGRRARANGYGLAGMRERSALVGGRFVVRSRPGHGTQITVDVPLDQAQDEGRGRGGDEHSDRKHEREGA